MAYLLPVHINKRRYHRLKLEDIEDENPIPSYEFVISKPKASNIAILFNLNTKDKILQYHQGTKEDKHIGQKYRLSWLDQGEAGLPVLQLYLNPAQEDTAKDEKLREMGILAIPQRPKGGVGPSILSIQVKGKALMNTSIEVEIYYGDTHKGSFILHICSEKNFYRVAIDFGSEASQVAYKSDATYFEIRRLDLLNQLKKKKFYDIQRDKKDFIQNDDDHGISLLKSNSFIEKEFDFLSKTRTQKPLSSDPISLIATTDDEEIFDKVPIPNFKLSNICRYGNVSLMEGGYENDLFDMEKEIQRSILNKFLHAIFYRLQPSKPQEDPTHHYYELTFLVPNIYSQEKVNTLVEHLTEDIRKIQALSDGDEGTYKIGGFEIKTISESDASFCGFVDLMDALHKPNFLRSNQNYLIIDAGKGTIDFSILRSGDQAHDFEGVYRAGVPGSGQVISFAILEAIAAQAGILRYDLIRGIGNGNYSTQIKWMQLIEKIKIDGLIQTDMATHAPENYAPTQARMTDEELPTQIDDLFLKVEQQINNRQSIQDSYGFVNHAIDLLIKELEHKLSKAPDQSFYRIVLTGRAFRYQPFKQKILDSLEGKIADGVGKEKGFLEDKERFKSICMDGALSEFTRVNLDANTTGNLILDPGEQTEEEAGELVPAGGKKSTKGFMSWFKTSTAPKGKETRTYPINENLFWGLAKAYHYDPNIKYYIGGLNFKLRYPSLKRGDKLQVTLGYEGFYFRKEDEMIRPEYNPLKRDGELVLKTVFPYAGVDELLKRDEYKQESYHNPQEPTTTPSPTDPTPTAPSSNGTHKPDAEGSSLNLVSFAPMADNGSSSTDENTYDLPDEPRPVSASDEQDLSDIDPFANH